jgi:hypothetical protein
MHSREERGSQLPWRNPLRVRLCLCLTRWMHVNLIAAGDVVLCTSTLLYGMRPKSPADGPAIQRLASCEWVPGTNKHRTMLDVDATLVAPTNETSPFSPSGGGVGHGLMWKPNATRLAELQEIQDEEDEQIRQKAWICVLISLALALATAWLLTQKPTTP